LGEFDRLMRRLASHSTNWIALLALLTAPLAARAEDPVGSGHQLWKINTRHLSAYQPQVEELGQWTYSRFQDGQWTLSDAEDFDQGNEVPTCLIVHGSPASDEYVVGLTVDVFNHISEFLGPDKPIRIIVWSWPSDKMQASLIKDFRDQTIRSERQGFFLAHFLTDLRQSCPVMLVGYSMGSRTAVTGLHLIGGGQLPEIPKFEADHDGGKPIIGVLVAAAIDTNWLEVGQRYDKAVEQTSHFVVTVNNQDPILKRYPRLYGGKRSPQRAIGFLGIASQEKLASLKDRFTQIDITRIAGKSHDIRRITGSRVLLEEISQHTFDRLFGN